MNAAASSATGPSLHVDGVPKQVIQLTAQTYAYLVANTREPAVLAACREDTLGRRGAHMQVPPEQGALLAFLVEVLGARRVLEVGTFTVRVACVRRRRESFSCQSATSCQPWKARKPWS